MAVGKNVETNTSGDQLRDEFNEIKGALTTIYGPSSDFDTLKEGSIWNAPQDFMMSLVKKDRDLSSLWAGKSAEHLNGVVLEATASSSTTGVLFLYYEFEGWDEFLKERALKRDSVL